MVNASRPSAISCCLIAVSSLVVFAFFGLVESPARASASEGPVAAYSFDEGEGTSAEDVTGNGHTATIEGASWTRGRYGSALKFDGENDCLTVPESSELNFSEEFTLESWVKPEGELKHDPVIFKEGEGFPSYALGIGIPHSDKAEGVIGQEGKGHQNLYSSESLEAKVWSHLALTYDGAKLRLYVNGELVSSEAVENVDSGSAGPLTIGCDALYGAHFKGKIDELRVYDRVLSSAEVAADKLAPIQTPQAGPVAAYSFDEGEGTSAEDVTGNGHTATIEGATWTKGKYGSALKFSSEGDKVTIPGSEDLQFTEEGFTLEAWVKPSDTHEYSPIFTQEDEAAAEGEERYAYTLMARGGAVPTAWIREAGVEHGYEGIYGTESMPVNAWSHLALTDDGAKIRLYIDGELIRTAPSPPISHSEGALQIGGEMLFGNQFYGKIDEVRIYNRPLEGTEVAADKAAPIQTPQAGPVAAYSFDEGEGTSAEDVTGNGHTATIEGATWTKGKYGSALKFSSEGDKVTIPGSEDLQFTEEGFTLEAWVKPSDTHEYSPIFTQEDEAAAEGEERYAYTLMARGGAVPTAWIREAGVEHGYEGIYGTESMPVNAWSHLALTDDGAKIRLYIDGELIRTAPSPPISHSEGALQIGGEMLFGNQFYGKIDEVRIYNRPLEGTEVAADKAAPIQTPQAGPVAAYSFDEGEGTSAEDVTGNGHTGMISGAEWVHGKYGGALKFNGTSSCVSIADATDLRLGEEFTLESWVKAEGELKKDPIVFKEGSSYPNYSLDIGHATTGKGEGSIGVAASPNYKEATSTVSLEANVWTHLATSFDGAKLRLYVNGELVATKAIEGSNSGREGALKIGCDSQYSEHFKGRIDEVKVYNRALSAGEVATDEAPETSPPTISLSGALAEGITEEGTSFPLEILATDGTPEDPGTGVRRITVEVDGQRVYNAVQPCELGHCPMSRTWTYMPAEFEGPTHEILVSAEDQVGNIEDAEIGITPPDGDVTDCNANEEATSGPSRVEELPSGGTDRVFEGKEFTYEQPIPPPGFDPLKATAGELAEYDFPARPKDTETLDEWQETMESYKETVPSNLCIAPRSEGNSAEVVSKEPGVFNSSNWSGYLTVDPKAENTWVGITGTFIQPYYHPTQCEHTRSNHWVGLGGIGEKGHFRLIQAGTVIGTDHKIRPFLNFLQPAYEHGDLRVPGIKIGKKDSVRITLFYELANERLIANFFDNSTGKSTRWGVQNLPHQFYDGSTGDFIDERSTDGATGKYYDLPNFVKNEWFATKVYTKEGDWQKLSNANPKRVFMEAGGHLLAAPGYLRQDGKSFTNNFFHCSP
jgi:hypothetical protein